MGKKEVITQERIKVPGIVEVTDPNELAEYEGVIGAGQSESVEDRGTPLLYVAQKQSPQCEERDAKYIKDLKAGMAFNNLTGQMYDTEHDGMPFLPCYMRMVWSEWTPRDDGGGFHGEHHRSLNMESIGAKPFRRNEKSDPRRDIFVMPNGHELKLTAKYYGVIPMTWSPIIIPMALTSLGCSTKLQALIESFKVMINGRILPKPAYHNTYVLKTTYESNDDGSWFQWAVGEVKPTGDKNLREFCRQFAIACAKNEVKESKPLQEVASVRTAPKDGDVPI